MPIIFKTGDIFSEPNLTHIINTVNCVGVMGKGLALEFKKRYPKVYEEYKENCDRSEYKPGSIFFSYQYLDITIINFATKDHWRNPSQIEWIEKGLIALRAALENHSDYSVGIPPLGCGLGGLHWKDVKSLIIRHLGDLPTRIVVFEPA